LKAGSSKPLSAAQACIHWHTNLRASLHPAMDTYYVITYSLIGAVSLWLAIGYLSGSIPYGLLIAKAFGLGNLRSIGSGNIGATNVLRTGSKPAAAATLLLDALKGTIPVLAPIPTRRSGSDCSGIRRISGAHLPGLAEVQGRQGRCHLCRHPAGLRLAVSGGFCCHLAQCGGDFAVFVARCPDCLSGCARLCLLCSKFHHCTGFCCHDSHRLSHTSHQHFTVARGRGKPHRQQGQAVTVRRPILPPRPSAMTNAWPAFASR
jgi:hypothetical protein